MMKKFLIIISIFLTLLSCTKKQKPENVINLATDTKIIGFDPATVSEIYSAALINNVYDRLLQYSYLERPYKLVPLLAERPPKISKDGLTYEFTIKKNVFFTDDEAFAKINGKGRELVASDIVYSIKRLADSKNRSQGWAFVDGWVLGLNEFRKINQNKKKPDYDIAVSGLHAPTKYTFILKLTKPNYQFIYLFAMPFMSIVAREVVEFYGKEFLNHPVGTGPFILTDWIRGVKLVLKRNKNYREEFYPSVGESKDLSKGFLQDSSKKIPFLDKVICHIMIEAGPRWLNFLKGKIDFISIPRDNYDSVFDKDGKIQKWVKDKGIEYIKIPRIDYTYIGFNNEDPILGKNKYLRQAISLAHDTAIYNKIFYNNRMMLAQGPIPPGIEGYDPNFENDYSEYDLEKAKDLLVKAGYPGGKGLPVFTFEALSASFQRQLVELFTSQMSKIGIKIKHSTNTWAALSEKIKTRKAQLFDLGWDGDYPDAENFLQMFYGPNKSPGANLFNYDNPYFNKLFSQAKALPDSPERTKLYKEMVKVIAEDCPCIFMMHRTNNYLKHGWVKNFKYHAVAVGMSKYYKVDPEVKSHLKENL